MKWPWKRDRRLLDELRVEASEQGAIVGPDLQRGAAPGAFGADKDESTRGGETYAGKLMADGGLAPWGIPRERGDWDAVVSVNAPALDGDEVEFVVIEGGDVFMESSLPDGDVSLLADAVEKEVQPPYRARAVRHEGDLWTVSARRLRLERFEAVGDEIELTVSGTEHKLVVDGQESLGTVPPLELRGRETVDHFFAHAVRIEDDLWEVEINPL